MRSSVSSALESLVIPYTKLPPTDVARRCTQGRNLEKMKASKQHSPGHNVCCGWGSVSVSAEEADLHNPTRETDFWFSYEG